MREVSGQSGKCGRKTCSQRQRKNDESSIKLCPDPVERSFWSVSELRVRSPSPTVRETDEIASLRNRLTELTVSSDKIWCCCVFFQFLMSVSPQRRNLLAELCTHMVSFCHKTPSLPSVCSKEQLIKAR